MAKNKLLFDTLEEIRNWLFLILEPNRFNQELMNIGFIHYGDDELCECGKNCGNGLHQDDLLEYTNEAVLNFLLGGKNYLSASRTKELHDSYEITVLHQNKILGKQRQHDVVLKIKNTHFLIPYEPIDGDYWENGEWVNQPLVPNWNKVKIVKPVKKTVIIYE